MSTDSSRPISILHCFADHGTEAEPLAVYGDVFRVGIEPRITNDSRVIQADAHELPFRSKVNFDFGLFHPPCTKWSDMPDANKAGDAQDLIPLARRIAGEFCDFWVIENKPRAPLKNPVVLNGKMFGLPIMYERAFETNFSVEQPPRQTYLTETESSPYFYSEMSREWWASVKGLNARLYSKESLCKNSVPSAYIHHLARAWIRASGLAEGPSDFNDYDKRMDKNRSQAVNMQLSGYTGSEPSGH